MKLIFLHILYAVFAVCLGYKTSIDRKDGKIIAPFIHSELDKQNIPGLAIAVIQNNKMIYSDGFGTANVLRKTTVKPDETLFRIASISKPITAALISRLYENGMLHPDSSIYKYLPDYPKKRYDFSIKQVGGHTAGIRSYKGNEFYSDSSFESVSDAIQVFSDDPLMFEPGKQYAYSSYGWNLLSYVAERVVSKPFLKLISDSLYAPLGLNHTFPNDPFVVARDKYRSGYYKDLGDTITDEVYVDLSNKWAGGGFESTAEDVAWFAARYWFGDYVSETTRQLFTISDTLENGKETNYGIGWMSGIDGKGRQYYGHGGSGIGARAMLLVYPDYETVLVILSNKSKADLKTVYTYLADYFLE